MPIVEKSQLFSVAVAVLDRLDLINLQYGPECGDDILRRFAIRLREQLPQRVFLCRWGGPAFVAVVERLPAGDVRAMVKEILNDIAAEPVEMQTKGAGLIRMTSRFAVHQWNAEETLEKFVKLVEVFCFEEKKAGSPETESSPAKVAG